MQKPKIVRPITVTHDDLSSTIPPFITQHGDDEDKALVKIKEAIEALVGVRNTFVAHFDIAPNPQGRRAVIHDLDRVITSAAIVVREANFYVLGRRVDVPELKRLLEREAGGFVTTLTKGFG